MTDVQSGPSLGEILEEALAKTKRSRPSFFESLMPALNGMTVAERDALLADLEAIFVTHKGNGTRH